LFVLDFSSMVFFINYLTLAPGGDPGSVASDA